MRVGFTGTREGMTRDQFLTFAQQLPHEMTWFRHGCCVGADHEAAVYVDGMKFRPGIFGAPSNIESMTSAQALKACDDTTGRLDPPLERNRIIVDGCDLLIACPAEMKEGAGGTRYTVRYARKKGKRIIIVWPDGTTTEE
jgi:hypothetical protein